jgi:hypothetical protein
MVTREELFEAVWSEPLTKLAARYNVSGSYLARVCDSLRVPRPDRGYWAKKEVGKAPPKPSLPPVDAGAPSEWSSGNGVLVRRSGPRLEQAKPTHNKKGPRTHALLQGAIAHFTHSRKADEGDYLKPYKRHLVDITTSQACLSNALSFANALFLELEGKGHRVGIFDGQGGALRRTAIDPLDTPGRRTGHNPHYGLWSPDRLTIAHVNGQMIGLSIVEIAEATLMRYVGNSTYVRESDYAALRRRSRYHDSSTWTTTMERPSGRMRLIAYAPHHRVDFEKQWQGDDLSALTQRIPEIISGIEIMAGKLVELVAEAERQVEAERRKREAEWRRYEIEENKRQIKESIKASRDQLDLIIRHWAEMRAREDFLTGLEENIARLPETERTSVQTRLELARNLLGPIDPMSHFLAWSAPVERYIPRQFGQEEE